MKLVKVTIPMEQENVLEQVKHLKGISKSKIISLALNEFIRSGKLKHVIVPKENEKISEK